MIIRLEYSSIEGKFNQAQAIDSINVAKGYRMLCCFVNAERALRFTQAIEIKYPVLHSGTAHPFLRYYERRAASFFSRGYKSAGGAYEQNLPKTETIT